MRPALPGVRRLLHLRSAPSTQALARKLAEEGAPAWTLVWADRQTRGRGRMDRRWSSSAGGLYLSLILRPALAPSRLARLSRPFAEACARAIARTSGLRTLIKPPNDVLASPPEGARRWRKVCGILLEAAGGFTRVHWLVAGIGVNVNNRLPRSLPQASSLRELAGRRFRERELLGAVLGELRRMRL